MLFSVVVFAGALVAMASLSARSRRSGIDQAFVAYDELSDSWFIVVSFRHHPTAVVDMLPEVW